MTDSYVINRLSAHLLALSQRPVEASPLPRDITDKDRLDFLDECNRRLNASYGTNYHWKMVMNHNVNRLMLGSLTVDLNDADAKGLKSCRAAIDAEIKRVDYKPAAHPIKAESPEVSGE